MTQSKEQSQGLTCPNCNGVVPVAEGARIVTCPYCQMRSLVQGERGVLRWQMPNRIEREAALNTVRGFFSGIKKARDLKKEAEIKDIFLVYLPYWRVEAYVAGWMFGRVKSGKNSTRPVEVEIAEVMHWNDAAVDVSEFGVHRVALAKNDLQPYDAEQLHAEAMVFEPAESRTDALDEAEDYFVAKARAKRSLRSKYFEKFHQLRRQLALVYYPLWVARYVYRGRNYQVVVDGVQGKIAYGKAPGNIFYRAAALVIGLALGNLVLVDGAALMLGALSDGGDDGGGFVGVLIVMAIGAAIIAWGYRAFRYGEEIEETPSENRKAATPRSAVSHVLGVDMGKSDDPLEMGMDILDGLMEKVK